MAVVVRLIMIRVVEQLAATPGIAEVVFRTGAEGGGELLAIHEELLVALAPPAAARVPDMKHETDEAARALGLRKGQSGHRSRSARSKTSRCHLAWKRASCAMGRESGAWLISKVAWRGVLPSFSSSMRACLAKGMYQ